MHWDLALFIHGIKVLACVGHDDSRVQLPQHCKLRLRRHVYIHRRNRQLDVLPRSQALHALYRLMEVLS
jgi:hypothetical protein